MQEVKDKNIVKRVYQFFSNDLSSKEFEKVFLRETPARYKYLIRSMGKDDGAKRGFAFFRFVKNFFVTFLTKLSPVIRIIYVATILYFFVAMFQGIWEMGLLAFTVVNLLFMFEVAGRLTIRDELDVARDVQSGLIPQELSPHEYFDVSFFYETANEVGGDFFDHIRKDGRDVYIVGDVSGKGMSAALYMIQVKLLLRYIFDKSGNIYDVITGMNEAMLKYLKKGFFFTSIFAVVDTKNISLFRAGHNHALYYSEKSGDCKELKQGGMGMGLTNGTVFSGTIEKIELIPDKHDIILLYTDGLTETMNSESEEYGLLRLKKIIARNSLESADKIRDAIIDDLKKFRGYAEVHDDLTFLLLKARQ